MTNKTLFAQAIGKLPKEKIRKIIRESGTDKHCKGYDTWSQFVSMMFSQFSNCDSVRDISNGLNSANGNLNHLGIARAPSKSTIAYRIAIWNEEHEFTLQLLTNNMQLAASTVAELYKSRWQIEIFFRNLKQLLRIKSFIGTSRNAVETQIWTALTTMLLLCWLKHTARYKWGLANLVVSLRLNTFTKIDLEKWLNEPFTPPPDDNN